MCPGGRVESDDRLDVHDDSPVATDPGASSAPPPSRQAVPLWCSWPIIVILWLVCFIPGVVLVWMRPVTTTTTKWVATAVLTGIPVHATALDYVHNR